MKITFLGTGAADWPVKRPDDYTEYRRWSSALVDDSLLIDPGPQVLEALQDLKKDPKKIKYIINTHNHSDHFSKDTLSKLEEMGAAFFNLVDGDILKIDGYTIRAYRGNHATCEKTVHFIITDGEKCLFYGLDGAWLLYEEVQAIQKYRPDYAVFDATIGYIEGDYRIFEHNNLYMVLEMKKSLDEYIGKVCISHMARTLHTDHKSLCESLKNYNVEVAYDGFEVEI